MALPNVRIEPRSLVFVDTSAFISLLVADDELHSEAASRFAEILRSHSKLVTTEMIFFELLNSLSKIRYRQAAVSVLDDFLSNTASIVVWSDRDLFDAAYGLYADRADKDWSLTDCTSFVVMKQRGIKLAFTSDKHFEQAGFIKLLEN